ncbi:unnamed protein product [Polarella glacialis]|uniref:Sugar phosphate transporter domain-containing protein n=1 Tax=Polarella glacialis TaxID=89957 RepID=A0A813D6D6_POLGL|nr:unnamed protein product [Polarella glacialis]
MAGSTVDANADARRSADLELGPAVGSWMICSVGMMIFNKGAIGVFPLECTLTGLQMAFTVLAMLVFCFRSIHIGSARDVLRWSLVAPFFTGMLLTSILALKNAPMTLVIVFRSLSPVLALAIERFYPNPLAITPAMLWAIAVMIAGTGLYASTLERDSFVGIQWVLLNMVFAVGDRLLQRLMLAKDQHPVDISKTGVTLLNNALGMLPLLVMAGYKGEFSKVHGACASLDLAGWTMVAMSCVVGVGIGYTGIWAQSLISATSFLVLVNANKFVIIFLDAYVMKSNVLSTTQVFAAIITVLGGVLYGKARQDIEVQVALAGEKKPLVPQKV